MTTYYTIPSDDNNRRGAFTIYHNDLKYTLVFDVYPDRQEFRIWKGTTTIIELDFLPDITPANVEKKLPTLLTFL